jgi:hypothetical protein
MRHYPDLQAAGARVSRRARLFELHRQHDVQALLKNAGAVSETLRPDIALRLRDQAIRSLRSSSS